MCQRWEGGREGGSSSLGMGCFRGGGGGGGAVWAWPGKRSSKARLVWGVSEVGGGEGERERGGVQ